MTRSVEPPKIFTYDWPELSFAFRVNKWSNPTRCREFFLLVLDVWKIEP